MSIEQIMNEYNKKSKETLLQFGIPTFDYKRIPFTSPRLNYMTFGGLPMGRLIEFFGVEHGGKTTTALDIVANYQNMDTGKKVLYVDAENTMDYVWATKLGVQMEDVLMYNPTTQGAEDIFDLILKLIEDGEIGLVVIDSLGVLVSNQAMEKDVADKTYGGISMALTQFSKKAVGLCHRTECTIIGINQMRDDMNSPYGGLTTTGGKAWRHNTTARLEFRQGNYYDSNGNQLTRSAESPASQQILVSMPKNKACPPTHRTGFYTLNFAEGIDYLKDLIEVGIKCNVVKKSGAWYDLLDVDTGEMINTEKIQGATKLKAYLEANTDVLQRVEALIDKHIGDYDE